MLKLIMEKNRSIAEKYLSMLLSFLCKQNPFSHWNSKVLFSKDLFTSFLIPINNKNPHVTLISLLLNHKTAVAKNATVTAHKTTT